MTKRARTTLKIGSRLNMQGNETARISPHAHLIGGHVFTTKLSGAVNTVRPGLAAILHCAREGDAVVVNYASGKQLLEVALHLGDAGRIESLGRMQPRSHRRSSAAPKAPAPLRWR